MKASTPLSTLLPAALVSSIFLSRSLIPVSRVRRNDSSSSLITFSINPFCATNSGYASPIVSINTGSNLYMKASLRSRNV
ncbi:hypothetical protein EVA_16440 [gut metagenome]|uniref:Uncharacterized protein n=1 Tax=gut metagenome TaxID=749906 RepID=J9G0W6_9ZZZZ